jgi:hypothetical protein
MDGFNIAATPTRVNWGQYTLNGSVFQTLTRGRESLFWEGGIVTTNGDSGV